MTGIVDFRTELLDENGNPITAANPLPTTGGGGGGGGALADVLLTDDTGALFVARDDGTAVTYFNLNTNAVYTPTGTIQAAGLTNAQLRAAPLQVAESGELITLFVRMLNYLNSPQGYDKSLGRNRVTATLEGSSATIGQVNISANQTLANITNLGGVQAQILPNAANLAAWQSCVRARIT